MQYVDMASWKDGVIQTGVDKLMEYLEKEGEVGVKDAAASLDVEEKTVIKWAKSLEESGLAEIQYTTRHGRVLRPVENAEHEEAMEEIADHASERLSLLEDRQQEQARLERFQDVLDQLMQTLQEQEQEADTLQEQFEGTVDELDELEQYLDDADTVEEDIEELREHISRLKQDISALSTLEQHRMKDVEDTEDSQESSGILGTIRSKLSFGSTDEESEDAAADAEDEADAGDEADEDAETYECEECGRSFDTVRGLQTHQGMTHRKKEQGETQDDSAEEPVETVSKEEPDSGDIVSDESGREEDMDQGETYKCEECGSGFETAMGLQTHERIQHRTETVEQEESV